MYWYEDEQPTATSQVVVAAVGGSGAAVTAVAAVALDYQLKLLIFFVNNKQLQQISNQHLQEQSPLLATRRLRHATNHDHHQPPPMTNYH